MNLLQSTISLICLLLWVGVTDPGHAQRLYKYQDADGVWVYSDRQPEDGQQYQFQYIPGDPAARHDPQVLYRLPYASAESFHVSQAYPDQATHADPTSLYAIDFQMPVGSGVYAARGGIVIEVASDFYQSGTDRDIDGPRANVVRVHHDDGTMSLYAHLNWNSIGVVPGQRVERGEYLAGSGNTGFSTGPHLHFAVQRNQNGAIVSIPIQFAARPS